MSNAEVVLKMLVNRLEQFLELIPEFKEKWNAEITELIHLGKGVIVEAPEPVARAARPRVNVAATFEQDRNEDWHLPVSRDMIEMLYNQTFTGDDAYTRQELVSRITSLFDISYSEPDYDGDDDEPDDDDNFHAELGAQLDAQEPQAGPYFVGTAPIDLNPAGPLADDPFVTPEQIENVRAALRNEVNLGGRYWNNLPAGVNPPEYPHVGVDFAQPVMEPLTEPVVYPDAQDDPTEVGQ